MRNRVALAWPKNIEALLGTMPDSAVAAKLGVDEERARYRRLQLGIPAFRLTLIAAVRLPCANCGIEIKRKRRDLRRSKHLFCSKTCAAAGQKKRDSDMLRYGPGWKKTRALIRARDQVCRACGKTPRGNQGALHVHHLKPYRIGGSNHPSNLVALCDPCHHMIEAVTTSVLDSIPFNVALDGSFLTITMDGTVRWRGSVVGAAVPTASGSNR